MLIYSNSGKALGSIETSGEWLSAPSNSPVEVEKISNFHLKKVVKKLCQSGREGKDFIKFFQSTLNNALYNIESELAQFNLGYLLIGRPIAVVRGKVNLELQGLPPFNQNWQVFRRDMRLQRIRFRTQRKTDCRQRETDGFTDVEFSIRIDEYQQLNDGVIGYWKEQKKYQVERGYKYERDIFYAQQSDAVESKYIEPQYWGYNTYKDIEEVSINIIQTLDSKPQKLTLLVEPCHAVHISARILPTKIVTIPSEHYVPILEAFEVSLLTSPILTYRDSYNLPLPKVPQYTWSCLEKKKRIMPENI